ncbi:MAG: glycosyltransferase family 39 protein, partial [Singulisphaera sp.]
MARRPPRSRPAPRPETGNAPRREPAAALSSAPAAGGERGSGSFWTRSRIALAVGVLVSIHLVLAVRSLVLESPTIDEVVHLPAGLTYWEKGTFRLYHHNPPLIKLVAALPVLASGVVTAPLYQNASWRSEFPNKAAFAHEFAQLNARQYFELFTRARLLMPAFSALGALVVFAWSRRLYGVWGGMLSLSLWVFCPNVLAHARLITTDLGATALAVLATFVFRLYLQRPDWKRATLAGLCLGMAQLSKFSLVLFYGLWPLLGIVHLLANPDRVGLARRSALGAAHAAWILVLSILTIDAGYAFEKVGTPLGRFPFVSRSLTSPAPPPRGPIPRNADLLERAWRYRVNRFRGTLLQDVPVPLPEHYMLGFDEQKLDAEGVPKKFFDPGLIGPEGDEISGYPVYLDGELRQKSWKSYYLKALTYKVPEGTWALVVLSMAVLVLSPRSRANPLDELILLSVPIVFLVAITFFTNINIGLRYVLPIFPFVMISAGKLAPWMAGLKGRASRRVAGGAMGICLTATATATLAIHPHYLAYFNVVSGGPTRGPEHLIDSNIDWGQDLVNLRRWLAQNAPPGELDGIAYF